MHHVPPVQSPIKDAFRRIVSGHSLNAIASIIATGIFALSLSMLWQSRQDTWRQAKQSSHNLLTAVVEDIGSSIRLHDLFLQGVVSALGTEGLQQLPQQVQHKIIFDPAASVIFMRPILLLNAEGEIVGDASSIAPRVGNFADRDYFTVHKERADVGLYVSRPYQNRLRGGEWSISISRRVSKPDGGFAGIVAAALPLSKLNEIFTKLQLGREGSITLLRDDGVLLTRQPLEEGLIGKDFGTSPNTSRMLREEAGEFIGASRVDGVSRHFAFARVEGLPLIVHVAKSVAEIFAQWWQKAIVMSLITLVLCSAVIGLTYMFQRELRRRTAAEAELARLAATDSLTGLPNRRAFDEFFEREWNYAIMKQVPLSLLFIDADCFKRYNDHYGHSEGDALLRRIANVLRAQLFRPRDYAARYGGEEFTVLLPETEQNGAIAVAERVRQAIRGLAIAHEASPQGVLTMSIGVGTIVPHHGEHPSMLLNLADTALYQAKAAGRDSVKASGPHRRADGRRTALPGDHAC